MENTLLNLIPAAYLPEVHISQYDIGRTLTFNLKEGASDYNVPTGATVTVKATKPSGFGFAVPCTFSGGVVTLVVTETMTPEHGRFPAELSIVSGNTTIGTSNFIFNIERSPHPEETIDGDAETIIPELTLLVERVEAAASSVLDMQVVANTLPPGSQATYSYDESLNKATFGIPQGEPGAGAVGTVASAYDASETYDVGDYAIHNNDLYRCITAITTAEAFTDSHWIRVVLADDVIDLKSDINDIAEKVESKNLFNGEIIENTYYNYATVSTLNGYCCTKKIHLTAGDYLFPSTKSEMGQTNGQRVWIINSQGDIANYIDATVIGTVTEADIYANRDVLAFTLDSDEDVIINVGLMNSPTLTKPQLSNFMLVRGTTIADFGTYEAYFEPKAVLKDDVALTEAMVTEVNGLSGLLKKTAIFCGDSICEAIYDNKEGWAGAIGKKNHMTWKNYGLSGMTIARETGHNSILNMSYTMEAEFPDADYIIFEGGSNDADVIGSILNGNVPTKFGSYNMTDYSGTYDDTTFCGAVEKLFYRMITVWDKKKIGFIIAHKMGKTNTGYTAETNNRRAYFETIITLCKKWGIPYINLWDGCYLNPSIPTCYNSNMSGEENRANGYPIYDGQHLSSEGYAVVSPMIETWMKSL